MEIPMKSNLPGPACARTLLGIVLTALAAQPATAQTPPAARPADVASIDAIFGALYDVISGPKGQARDWDRFKSLFLPEARLVATGKTPDGTARYNPMTPDGYVQASGQTLVNVGFMEIETARTVEQFGQIAHAFSTYESKFTPQEQVVTQRGINSIQLFNDGHRWWILTIFWDSERPDNPIPPKYMSGRR
jgi:hypothetical protein